MFVPGIMLLATAGAEASLIEVIGNVSLRADAAQSCVQVRLQNAVGTTDFVDIVKELDSYDAGLWTCTLGSDFCETFYSREDGRQKASEPSLCGLTGPGVTTHQLTDYPMTYQEETQQLILSVKTSIKDDVKVTGPDALDEVTDPYTEGWHLWGLDSDRHAYADFAITNRGRTTSSEGPPGLPESYWSVVFVPGIDTSKVRGSWNAGIPSNALEPNPALGEWDVAATVHAMASLNQTDMMFDLNASRAVVGEAANGWPVFDEVISEVTLQPEDFDPTLVGTAVVSLMDGTTPTYQSFIDDVSDAAQNTGVRVGWSVDDFHGDFCDPYSQQNSLSCLDGSEVRDLADYGHNLDTPVDFYHYQVDRLIPLAMAKSYWMGAMSRQVTTNDLLAQAFTSADDYLTMGITVTDPGDISVDETIRLSFLYYDEFNEPYLSSTDAVAYCDKDLAMGVYHDPNGAWPFSGVEPVLEDFHYDGHDDEIRRRKAVAAGGSDWIPPVYERIELAKIEFDGADIQGSPTMEIRLSHPYHPPTHYDPDCTHLVDEDTDLWEPSDDISDWRNWDESAYWDTGLYVWDIRVEIIDAQGVATPIDFDTPEMMQIGDPEKWFVVDDSDNLDTRFNSEVDAVLVNLKTQQNLYEPHATSSGRWTDAEDAWVNQGEEVFSRSLASVCDNITPPAKCVYTPRAYENAIVDGTAEGDTFLDGERMKIAYEQADGMMVYQFPLTMYPSTDANGVLGTMMDQGSFAPIDPSVATGDRMTIWRKESPTLIDGWYQAFEGESGGQGPFDYCYTQFSDRIPNEIAEGRMDHRVIVSDTDILPSPLDFSSGASAPEYSDCIYDIDVPLGETIRVEHRLLGSPGAHAVWLDFEILESNNNTTRLPMDYFESGATKYAVDFYRCTANYWISGSDTYCD